MSDQASLIVPPNGTIGILGGGQLARMLAIAGANLGLRAHVFCPDQKAPSYDVAGAKTIAPYDDEAALAAFAQSVDVITYEFENVPAQTVAFLESKGACVRPGARALTNAQDRLIEKQFIGKMGGETAAFEPIDSVDDLRAAIKTIGLPAILKTRRLGYDGKGQTVLKDLDTDLSDQYEKACEHAFAEIGAAPSILEGFVPFACEASVIAARSADGTIAAYEPARNVHTNGILSTSNVPAKIAAPIIDEMNRVTAALLDGLGYIGVVGVEFFITKDGACIVNEFAPRVHNSGHWTQNACAVSQFEQHMRAVAGWPLGTTARHSNCEMRNLLGTDVHEWQRLADSPNNCLHLYGKADARKGRKMGHVNIVSPLSD